MHRYITLLFCATVLFSLGCTKESLGEAEALPQLEDNFNLSHEDVATYIKNQLEETQEPFDWLTAPDDLLWGGLKHGNNYAAIGYQPAGFENLDDKIHEIDVNDEEWLSVRDELMNLIVTETNRLFPDQSFTDEDLIMDGFEEDNLLPDFGALIMHPDIMLKIRNHPAVRYLDADDYTLEEINFRSLGCDGGGSEDILRFPPAIKRVDPRQSLVPWMYEDHNIEGEWPETNNGLGVTGCGIGVAVIDVGLRGPQPIIRNDNGIWNSSWSDNRNGIDARGALKTGIRRRARERSPYQNDCSHGTQMVGLVGAPRRGFSIVGVAYEANVTSYRASHDVVINRAVEKNGVKTAFARAGDRGDIHIISMSMGNLIVSRRVRDGVNRAYNRGKMIFCAAGTTSWFTGGVLSGVIFPASMDVVQAVSGVKKYPSNSRCETCHLGPKVDFVATVQSSTDSDLESPTLANSGNTPSQTLGSSPSTAMTAGMAALVWSSLPNWNRDQVLARLKATAQYPYGQSLRGHGRINVFLAAAKGRRPCNF